MEDASEGEREVSRELKGWVEAEPERTWHSGRLNVLFDGVGIPELANKVLFGDNPSGEIFYFDADRLPAGGQDPIRRVLLNDRGTAKPLLAVIRDRNFAQGRATPYRCDLRFGTGADDQVFLLNKQDGISRLLVPNSR